MTNFQIPEPPVDPLDDTHPTQTVPMVDPHGTGAEDHLPTWRLAAGLFSLIGAAGFTLASAVVLLTAGSSAPTVPVPTPGSGNVAPIVSDQTASATPLPTTEAQISSLAPAPEGAPTLSADAASSILQQPVEVVSGSAAGAQVVINRRDPFTVIPDRPRSEVIQYTVVQGDTINTIAERYGLRPETIAWSNPRGIVIGLLPGMVLNILPVDGVYHQANGFETISDIAEKYQVEAITIIDSPFNRPLGLLTPETLVNAGQWVVVPGGEGESINWNPQVVISGGSGSSGGGTGDNVVQQPQTVTFAPGEAGSCPPQEIAGGTAWINPLPNGTWMRGFDGIHTGVDLASPEGTPVKAANGGRVIFAGWNSFGYGYAIVMIHGPYIMTLYGHLSDIYVGCGQYVDAGTVIGAVGTTGNSTGPHLHFEILSRQANGGWVPTNPSSTLGF